MLGFCLVQRGEARRGLDLQLESKRLLEELVQEQPDNKVFRRSLSATFATVLTGLGAVGDVDRLEQFAERAYRDMLADIEADPLDARALRSGVVTCFAAGDAEFDLERYERAAEWFYRGLELLDGAAVNDGVLGELQLMLGEKVERAEAAMGSF